MNGVKYCPCKKMILLSFKYIKTTKMSQSVIKTILRAQNEDLLSRIAERFKLDKDELISKYLRPSFFLPIPTDTGVTIECVDKHDCRRFKDRAYNNTTTS